MKLEIKPFMQHVSAKPYIVSIVLRDLNSVISKSTKYQIRITVSNETVSQAQSENGNSAYNTSTLQNSTSTSNLTSQANSTSSQNSSNSSASQINGDPNNPFTVKADNEKQGNSNLKGSSQKPISKSYANLKLVEVTNQGEAKIKIIAQLKEQISNIYQLLSNWNKQSLYIIKSTSKEQLKRKFISIILQIFNSFTKSSFNIKVSSREDSEPVKYTIEGLNFNIMTLKLNFTNPSRLSNTQTFDMLQIITSQEIQIKSQYLIEIIKKDIFKYFCNLKSQRYPQFKAFGGNFYQIYQIIQLINFNF